MNTSDVAPLIEELNRLWLEAAREVAMMDMKVAAFTFDMTAEEVSALKQKSLVELREGAQSPVALFAPREALRHWLKSGNTAAVERNSIVQALLRDVGSKISGRAATKGGPKK